MTTTLCTAARTQITLHQTQTCTEVGDTYTQKQRQPQTQPGGLGTQEEHTSTVTFHTLSHTTHLEPETEPDVRLGKGSAKSSAAVRRRTEERKW